MHRTCLPRGLGTRRAHRITPQCARPGMSPTQIGPDGPAIMLQILLSAMLIALLVRKVLIALLVRKGLPRLKPPHP